MFEKIIERMNQAAGRLADLSADAEKARAEVDHWEDRRQHALDENNREAFIKATQMRDAACVQREYAEQVYKTAKAGQLIDQAEAQGIYADLRRLTEQAYEAKAREMLPHLRELERLSADAEALLIRYKELVDRLNELRKSRDFSGVYEERAACFADRVKTRREAIEKTL